MLYTSRFVVVGFWLSVQCTFLRCPLLLTFPMKPLGGDEMNHVGTRTR